MEWNKLFPCVWRDASLVPTLPVRTFRRTAPVPPAIRQDCPRRRFARVARECRTRSSISRATSTTVPNARRTQSRQTGGILHGYLFRSSTKARSCRAALVVRHAMNCFPFTHRRTKSRSICRPRSITRAMQHQSRFRARPGRKPKSALESVFERRDLNRELCAAILPSTIRCACGLNCGRSPMS